MLTLCSLSALAAALAACAAGGRSDLEGTGGGASTGTGTGGAAASTGTGGPVLAPGDAVWSRPLPSVRATEGIGALLVATDAAGHTILAGSFSGTIDLGRGALTASGSGVDTFVAALDASGNTLWNVRLGAAGEDDVAQTLAVDRSGTIFVTGAGAIAAAPGTTAGTFLAVLDPGGTVLTTRSLEAAGVAQASAIDPSGNLVLAGETFGAQGQEIDGWIAKYDPAGTLRWSKILGGPDTQRVYGVGVDAGGNVLAGGVYRRGIVIGTELVRGSIDGLDGFVASFAPDGTPRWHVRNTLAPVFDVAVDGGGQGVVLGQGSVESSVPIGERNALYVQAFSSSGDVRWSHPITAPEIAPGAIAVDDHGNVGLTATILGVANVGDHFEVRSQQGYDQLVTELQPSGRVLWATSLDAGPADKGPSSIAFDPAGRPVVASFMTNGALVTMRASGTEGQGSTPVPALK